jgi:sugar phosphate isomerase/epimerase
MKLLNMNRRQFFHRGLAGSTALAAAALPRPLLAAVTKAPREPFDGLKLGMASYSLRMFSLEESLSICQKAGVKYISLKDVHLPMKSTTAERQETRRKVEAAGLTIISAGVINMKNDEGEIRAAFEYAKDAGIPTIVCSPEPEALDLVEKTVKQYDIRVAIHNHGPGDKKFPSPLDVLRLVKERDVRMGLCIDVGHTVRIGVDPVAAINQCAKRLYDFHLKDVTAAKADGKATDVGKGVIDIVGVFKALLDHKYAGHVGLEYEVSTKDPVPGIMESYAYARGVLAAI